jgi:hypothetical protein
VLVKNGEGRPKFIASGTTMSVPSRPRLEDIALVEGQLGCNITDVWYSKGGLKVAEQNNIGALFHNSFTNRLTDK